MKILRTISFCLLVLAIAINAAQAASTGLAAYWTFDTDTYSGGTFASWDNNSSMQGYTLGNATLTTTGGQYIVGNGALKVDSAPSDGSNSVKIYNPVVASTDTFTISSWYKLSDISNDGYDSRNYIWESPVASGQVSDWTLSLAVRDKGSYQQVEYQFQTKDGADIQGFSGVPVVQEEVWYHSAVIWDPQTRQAQYYHNGQLYAEETILGETELLNTTGFVIGDYRAANGGRNWDGYIDDVAVYKGTLDAAGVAGLYNKTYTPETVPVYDHLTPVEPISEPAPFVEGSWTMVLMPDTQYYCKNDTDAKIFSQMTQWIVDNKEERNIGLVTHVGDITDDNSYAQWLRAKNAMSTLDGKVPYIVATGNHDYTNYSGNPSGTRASTKLNLYLRASDNSLNNPDQGGILSGTYQEGKLENAYYEITAPDGRKMLIFSLEFAPRQEIVDWANSIATQEEFSDHTAFLLTHAYLYKDNTRYDWDTYGTSQKYSPHKYSSFSPDLNDGEEIWDELVSKNKIFEGVFSGHMSGSQEDDCTAYLKSTGDEGNVVHQMLFDTQFLSGNGGDGWMRLLEFLPDGKTVRVKTYSPYLDEMGMSAWRDNEINYFEFELSPLAIPGDANHDGRVDGSDVTILAGNWQHGVTGEANATWAMGDFNGDGRVDGSDVTILAGNWQHGVTAATTAVPEPGCVILLLSLLAAGLVLRV